MYLLNCTASQPHKTVLLMTRNKQQLSPYNGSNTAVPVHYVSREAGPMFQCRFEDSVPHRADYEGMRRAQLTDDSKGTNRSAC
jgi:hypothetical protein